jgi:peptidoglycan hydrolase-like protein with peptidoglycan-binding domain
MSRSIWAAALGVSVFALAATFSASPGEPAQPASIHAEQASYPVPIVHHIVPVQTPALRHPARHANAIRHPRHSAARPLTQSHIILLAPGSGFQQAAGSGPVRALQRRLTGLGFAPGPIDGRYGPLTTQAVERFQNASGLIVDGIVGPRSVAALSARPSSGLAPGAGYQQAAGSGRVRVRVRVLQRRLARLGFAPGPIDGRYGPLTTHAVERFQSARRLTVNGVAGTGTLRVLLTVQRRSPVTVSSPPRPSSQPHSAVPARSPAPVSSQPHSAVPAASTTPVDAAPVSGEHSPGLPVVPVLLALAALGIAVMLLRSGRTHSRERRELALHEQIPRGFASELADVRDADRGTGEYGR